MDSVAAPDHAVLSALNHADSDDVFQRMLSLDLAIQALTIAKTTVRSQSGDGNGNELAPKPEDVPQPIDEVDELVREFEGLQAAARHEFNLRARPLLRNLSILDLPDELLIEIFDCFKGWVDSDQVFSHLDLEVDTETIKNARLTCRRLCDISSHLLVPSVWVSPNLASLERLQQVADHPKICRGPRVFNIDASFYAAAIANDFRRFARMCSRKVRRKVDSLEQEIEERPGDEEWVYDTCDTDERDTIRADIKKYRRMLCSWRPFRSATGEHVSEDTQPDAAALALLKGHERYRELFEQQETILRNGVFARTIARAAARSRTKVWLCISDGAIFRRSFKPLRLIHGADSELAADPDRLVQFLLSQTLAWHTARDKHADEVPQSLLYELPLEMRAAGASLVGFRIDISTPYKLGLEPSIDQLDGLREVAKGLRFFGFNFGEAPNKRSYLTRTTGQVAAFYNYLSAAIGRLGAPVLSLSLGREFNRPLNPEPLGPGNLTTTSTRPINPELFSIGPLLTSPSWQRIKLIRLHNVSFHLHQLNKLVDMLQPGVRLDFFDIYLMSGQWADGLDYLRSKAGWGSSFLDPHGAECEDMTSEDYFRFFEDDPRPPEPRNLATRYILCIDGAGNPLRKNVELAGVELGP